MTAPPLGLSSHALFLTATALDALVGVVMALLAIAAYARLTRLVDDSLAPR